MKRKIWLWIIAAIVLVAVLFVPVPTGTLNDGGTREYTALTYKIVDWNSLTDDGVYEKNRVYFFADRNKSLDELWEYEKGNVEQKFRGTALELSGTSVLVEPIEGVPERRSSDRISFDTADLADIGAEVGTVVEITYTGGIMESYPAQIHATGWKTFGEQEG